MLFLYPVDQCGNHSLFWPCIKRYYKYHWLVMRWLFYLVHQGMGYGFGEPFLREYLLIMLRKDVKFMSLKDLGTVQPFLSTLRTQTSLASLYTLKKFCMLKALRHSMLDITRQTAYNIILNQGSKI